MIYKNPVKKSDSRFSVNFADRDMESINQSEESHIKHNPLYINALIYSL